MDHIVLTTKNLQKCLEFYVDGLNMQFVESNGRYSLKFGNQKLNIHTTKESIYPVAGNVQYGSLDLCFVTSTPIQEVYEELVSKKIPIELGIVERNGARG